jgi:hypothetical protein
MFPFPRPLRVLPLLAALSLVACSPRYNWRDYSSPDAPYRVMFPDKPSSHTRSIDLDGMTLDMTMTATQIETTMFAVGSAQAPDAAKAQAALGAMKTALVRNIGATVTKEKATAATVSKDGAQIQGATLDIEATGLQNGVPMRLLGHFEARNQRFYQVVVMGRAKTLAPDQVEQFMTSFKLL